MKTEIFEYRLLLKKDRIFSANDRINFAYDHLLTFMIVYFTFHDRIISVTLSSMTSAAPLSVVLSFFFKRERREKRAQRRSCLKGLQR